ncbi:MAG TPA: 4-hydroxyphenylacetate 3-hydroxylase N-terminal domain-containing protein, partial [Acidimicrobiales bacterium]|nr:4-hydroxyphenylacetate 3-hydroxylase N-terminal domain-containing protein [Acidimicrobiales bacterium]
MTGEEYRHSLSDGRITYLEGERVREVAEHPLLAPAVDRVADGYEWLGAKARSTGSSPLATIPRTPEDLREYMPLIHHAGMVAHVTYASLMTLTTAAGHLAGRSEYVERLLAFVDDAQTRDIRMTECITDAKGDRSRAPSQQTDADAYVRVVDRSRDGVVIRGAKLHITGASLGHELMVIPTKSMRAGEE